MIPGAAGAGAIMAVNMIAENVQAYTEVERFKISMNTAFNTPFKWTKSQIESPAISKLRDALRSELGGVLVFSCPVLAGKSWTMKDLIYKLRDTGCKAIYIDARKAHGCSSFCDFLYGALGCPPKAASHDLATLLPVSEGEDHTTIAIDHLEDVLQFPDTQDVIVGLARQAFDENSTSAFRVLVCVGPETNAQKVLNWNGKQKIRLAICPLAAIWTNDYLEAVLQNEPIYQSLSIDEREKLSKNVAHCFSPGKIKQLLRTSPSVHAKVASTGAAEWKAVENALREYVQNGLSPPILQNDEQITLVEEKDAAGNIVWRISKLS